MKKNDKSVWCIAIFVIFIILILCLLSKSKKENYNDGLYCYSLLTQASCDYYTINPGNDYYCADNYDDCQAALQSLN